MKMKRDAKNKTSPIPFLLDDESFRGGATTGATTRRFQPLLHSLVRMPLGASTPPSDFSWGTYRGQCFAEFGNVQKVINTKPRQTMMDTIFINNYGRPSCPNSYLDGLPSLKTKMPPWKWMVGRWISLWKGLFSGAMLVSGRVAPQTIKDRN